NRRLYDEMIGPAVIITALFIIVGLRGLHFKTVNITWLWFYDLVVRASDSYQQCLRSNEAIEQAYRGRMERESAATLSFGMSEERNGIVSRLALSAVRLKVRFALWFN